MYSSSALGVQLMWTEGVVIMHSSCVLGVKWGEVTMNYSSVLGVQ